MNKTFSLKVPGRSAWIDLEEHEVNTFDDFADPEREEILELAIDQELKLYDGALVKRTA